MKCPDLTNTESEPEFRVFSTCCAGPLPSGCSEAPARRPEAPPAPATSEEGALFPRPPQGLSFNPCSPANEAAHGSTLSP